jgi:hypothetical protein
MKYSWEHHEGPGEPGNTTDNKFQSLITASNVTNYIWSLNGTLIAL